MSWDLMGTSEISMMGQPSWSKSGTQVTRATYKSSESQRKSLAAISGDMMSAGANPLLMAAPAVIAAAAPLVDRFLFPEAGLFQAGAGALEAVPMQSNGGTYGVPFTGPGLKEPGGKYLLKEWHIRVDSKDGDFDLQYYLTMNDRGTKRIFMYNQRTKAWKSWPMPRLAVIGKNLPRHQMLTRLRRNLKRHTADAVTILKLTSPNKLESTRRPGGRYVRGRKRYID